jgi:TPR repeat protein
MSRFIGLVSKVLPRAVAKYFIPAARQQAAMDSRIQARSQLQGIMQDWSKGATGELIPGSSNSFDMIKVSAEADITKLSADEIEKLASQYFKGIEGCPLDRAKAVELWTKAADMGSWQAQFCIASCKLTGEGTARDPAGAFRLYEDVSKRTKSPMAEVIHAHVCMFLPVLYSFIFIVFHP